MKKGKTAFEVVNNCYILVYVHVVPTVSVTGKSQNAIVNVLSAEDYTSGTTCPFGIINA